VSTGTTFRALVGKAIFLLYPERSQWCRNGRTYSIRACGVIFFQYRSEAECAGLARCYTRPVAAQPAAVTQKVKGRRPSRLGAQICRERKDHSMWASINTGIAPGTGKQKIQFA